MIDDKNGEPVSLKTLQKLDELTFFDRIQAERRRRREANRTRESSSLPNLSSSSRVC